MQLKSTICTVICSTKFMKAILLQKKPQLFSTH